MRCYWPHAALFFFVSKSNGTPCVTPDSLLSLEEKRFVDCLSWTGSLAEINLAVGGIDLSSDTSKLV